MNDKRQKLLLPGKRTDGKSTAGEIKLLSILLLVFGFSDTFCFSGL